MSDDFPAPETLDSTSPSAQPNHSTAILIGLIALIVLVGGVVVAFVSHGSKHHKDSTPVAVSSPSSTPAPVQSGGPNIQLTPPIVTATPVPASPQPTGTASPGLAQAYQAAMARGGHAGSVHSVAVQTLSNGLHLRFDDLDGATTGSQRISIGTSVGLVRVVGSNSYFKGSAQVMAGFFGTTTKAAVADHDRWIHLTKGVRGYNSVTVNVTLSSTLAQDRLAGTLTKLAPQMKNGVLAYGITGHLPGKNGAAFPSTLWVAVGGNQLPVEFDTTGPQDLQSVQTFTAWGAPVHIAAPTSSVDGHGVFAKPSSSGAPGGSGPGVPV